MLLHLHKTILTVSILLTLAIPAFSQKDSAKYIQTNKGKFLVGMNANFYSENEETMERKSLDVQLQPRIGYFLLKNFAVGLNGTYAYERLTFYDQKYISNAFYVGPFVRYYLRYRNHGLFGELAYTYGKSITHNGYNYDPYAIKLTTLSGNYSFGIGYCYFVAKNASIELLYQFQIVEKMNKWEDSFNTFNFPAHRLNKNILTLGLQFYF